MFKKLRCNGTLYFNSSKIDCRSSIADNLTQTLHKLHGKH